MNVGWRSRGRMPGKDCHRFGPDLGGLLTVDFLRQFAQFPNALGRHLGMGLAVAGHRKSKIANP